MEKIGLIAGNGRYPLIFAQAAKSQGISVIAIAVKEEADPALAQYADKIYWIGVGHLKKLLEILRQENINKAVMVGQIKHKLLFSDVQIDAELIKLLFSLKDKKTDTILGAIADRISREGVELIDATTFIKQLLPEPGVFTKIQPTPEQKQDVEFGAQIAKAIAGLDIGQTVVVKDKVVLSVEAIEGTDEAIRRANSFCRQGAVVVKVSKPNQDMRFDVPLIGRNTVETLIREKVAVLAIEARKTLFLDREYVLEQADKNKICILAF